MCKTETTVHIFLPLRNNKSIVVFLTKSITNILSILIITNLYLFIKSWVKNGFRLNPKVNSGIKTPELWVLLLLFLNIITFIFTINLQISFWIAIYTLYNIFVVTIRDVFGAFLKSETNDSNINVKSYDRWLILAGINIIQILLCYSILYYLFGTQFQPGITDKVTATYQSFITFTTLGYGEITPKCDQSKLIVISELVFFMMFILIKLPLAISYIKIREIEK